MLVSIFSSFNSSFMSFFFGLRRLDCVSWKTITCFGRVFIQVFLLPDYVSACVWSQDDIPELAETFLVNITGVELMGEQSGAGQPRIRRPGMEIAEITIQENDDPRGVLQFNVSKVGYLLINHFLLGLGSWVLFLLIMEDMCIFRMLLD